MDEEEVELITVFATCRADGCGNRDIHIPMQVPTLDILMLCGVCSKEITEITDTEPERPVPPTEVPEWLE